MKALLLASIATFALSSIAFADTFSPAKMTDPQLDQVVAGCGEPCPPPTPTKGNNGWGNGADGINNGSDNGKTRFSKTANSSQPLFGKVNTNPTTSDGR